MIMAASEALAACNKAEDLAEGRIYPGLSDVRSISVRYDTCCSVRVPRFTRFCGLGFVFLVEATSKADVRPSHTISSAPRKEWPGDGKTFLWCMVDSPAFRMVDVFDIYIFLFLLASHESLAAKNRPLGRRLNGVEGYKKSVR